MERMPRQRLSRDSELAVMLTPSRHRQLARRVQQRPKPQQPVAHVDLMEA